LQNKIEIIMAAPKGKRPNSKNMVSLRLPQNVDALLRQKATERSITITALIEECIVNYLNKL
jgi:predicted HicB family RNase H-like nuclease